MPFPFSPHFDSFRSVKYSFIFDWIIEWQCYWVQFYLWIITLIRIQNKKENHAFLLKFLSITEMFWQFSSKTNPPYHIHWQSDFIKPILWAILYSGFYSAYFNAFESFNIILRLFTWDSNLQKCGECHYPLIALQQQQQKQQEKTQNMTEIKQIFPQSKYYNNINVTLFLSL